MQRVLRVGEAAWGCSGDRTNYVPSLETCIEPRAEGSYRSRDITATRVQWRRSVGRSRASVKHRSAFCRSWIKWETIPEVKKCWLGGRSRGRAGSGWDQALSPHQGMEHQLVQGLKYLSSAW